MGIHVSMRIRKIAYVVDLYVCVCEKVEGFHTSV